MKINLYKIQSQRTVHLKLHVYSIPSCLSLMATCKMKEKLLLLRKSVLMSVSVRDLTYFFSKCNLRIKKLKMSKAET